MTWDTAWDEFVATATSQYVLPSGLLRALIKHESNDDPAAIGDSGLARGLCQMHPTACQTVGKDWSKMDDPAAAIDAGGAYLSWCHRVTGDWTWALAAYNEGPTVMTRGLHYAEDVLAIVKPVEGD